MKGWCLFLADNGDAWQSTAPLSLSEIRTSFCTQPDRSWSASKQASTYSGSDVVSDSLPVLRHVEKKERVVEQGLVYAADVQYSMHALHEKSSGKVDCLNFGAAFARCTL